MDPIKKQHIKNLNHVGIALGAWLLSGSVLGALVLNAHESHKHVKQLNEIRDLDEAV